MKEGGGSLGGHILTEEVETDEVLVTTVVDNFDDD